jgi:hypothetical protein
VCSGAPRIQRERSAHQPDVRRARVRRSHDARGRSGISRSDRLSSEASEAVTKWLGPLLPQIRLRGLVNRDSPPHYPFRNPTSGSMREARSDGTRHASAATIVKTISPCGAPRCVPETATRRSHRRSTARTHSRYQCVEGRLQSADEEFDEGLDFSGVVGVEPRRRPDRATRC